MHLGGVLDNPHVSTLLAPDNTQFRHRIAGICHETLLIFRINPCVRNNPRTKMRADFVLVSIDDSVKRGAIDKSLLHQKRFEGLHAQRHVRRNGLMVVIVVMFMRLLCGVSSLGTRGQSRGARSRFL